MWWLHWFSFFRLVILPVIFPVPWVAVLCLWRRVVTLGCLPDLPSPHVCYIGTWCSVAPKACSIAWVIRLRRRSIGNILYLLNMNLAWKQMPSPHLRTCKLHYVTFLLLDGIGELGVHFSVTTFSIYNWKGLKKNICIYFFLILCCLTWSPSSLHIMEKKVWRKFS